MQKPNIEEVTEKIKRALSATNVKLALLGEISTGLAWTECLFGRGRDLLALPGHDDAQIGVLDGTDLISGSGEAVHFLVPKILGRVAGISHGPQQVRCLVATNLAGGWITPYLALCLAQRQHHAAIYWRPASAAQESEAPATLVLAASALDGEVQPMLITPGEAWGGGHRDKLLVGQVPLALVASLHETLRPLADATESVLAIVAAPDRMDAELSEESVPLADVLDSFGFAGCAPDLLDVTSVSRRAA